MSPTPYYASPSATLYHGDAAEVLSAIPKASADLLVTDPPYGMGWSGTAGNFERIAGDRPEDAETVAAITVEAIHRVRKGRHAYVFGPRHLTAGAPFSAIADLVWDKGALGTGGIANLWSPSHEAITFGVVRHSASERREGKGALSARLRAKSVLTFPRPNGRGVARHPTEKPVALIRRLIESSSCVGETVLDPFAGSGSTLVAAVLEGRRAVGIELDLGYCELIVRRLRWAERVAAMLEEDGEE